MPMNQIHSFQNLLMQSSGPLIRNQRLIVTSYHEAVQARSEVQTFGLDVRDWLGTKSPLV